MIYFLFCFKYCYSLPLYILICSSICNTLRSCDSPVSWYHWKIIDQNEMINVFSHRYSNAKFSIVAHLHSQISHWIMSWKGLRHHTGNHWFPLPIHSCKQSRYERLISWLVSPASSEYLSKPCCPQRLSLILCLLLAISNL